jgi:two-component system, cell cycle response regulator
MTVAGGAASLGLLGAGVSGLAGDPGASVALSMVALTVAGGASALGLRQGRATAAAEAAAHRLDPLTGLASAWALRDEVESFLATRRLGEQRELVIFDLVGFKKYNDTFGFACGDALLRRLAAQLRAALDGAAVYRLRGGQFAVLAGGDTALLRRLAADALFELGEGFMIRCAVGSVVVPEEAHGLSEALKLADQRVHAHRAQLRTTGIDESSIAAPGPNAPDGGHPETSQTALAVGEAMGLTGPEFESLELAVALRDVGMMALPDGLLAAPGRLSDAEWHFVSLHTLAGERMLRANFGMDRVASLVRHSHERWDGTGYPDGLSGEQIPLAARILFAVAAFEDMRGARPHRAALSTDEALRELDRSAGTQFDPAVVYVLADVVAAAPPGQADAIGSGSA